MAQHDYVIANGTGAAVRSDLNNALAAIVSNNSGATEPATMYAYQWWADTSTGLLKLRNAANNAWITLRELDGTLTIEAGTVSAPGLAFASDLNTGVWSPGADQFAIATNGVERVEWGTSEVVFNDGGANYDFRIEGDTNSSLFFVDASAEAVGIGTTSPLVPLVVSNAGAAGIELYHGSGFEGIQAYNRSTSAYTDLLLAGANLRLANATGEAARIDSSGRLLVGTSNYASNGIAVFQGNAQSSTGAGAVDIRLGTTRPTAADTSIGFLRFMSTSDAGNGNHYASVSAWSDGASTSDGDIPGRLVFSTTADGASSPTERMRISQSGFSTIVSTDNVLDGLSTQAAGTTYVVFQGRYGSTAGSPGTGTVSYKVFTNGNVENTNNSYTALSDIKLKENIVDASSQWDDLKALRVRNYNLKEGQTHRQIGLVAQEVEHISPGLVYESPDRDAEGNDLGTVTKSVNYSVLYMKAVKALQEAMERIEQLEAEMAEVKAQLS